MQENDAVGVVVIAAAALDRFVNSGGAFSQGQEIAIPVCPSINIAGQTGEIIASETETLFTSHAVLACYTREPPPDWNGDPLAPSRGEAG